MTVNEKAYAKLNYSLDVRARRDDGYHDLAMVMGSVSLWDDMQISLRSDSQITVKSNFTWIPQDEKNLAVRAAKSFFGEIGETKLGADIRICKRIPVGAGMAGGSTDAAATLRALNRLTGANMSADKLRAVALSVGSDVPYCVTGGMMLAEGRGEILTSLPELPTCRIVICKPDFSVSTADLFHRIDHRHVAARPDTQGLCAALRTSDLAGISRRMYNVFEDVLPRGGAEIASIRGALLDGGALGSVMTGTGSAVFGIFAECEKAEETYGALSAKYRECFLVQSVGTVAV